jgi:hypothetical protein
MKVKLNEAIDRHGVRSIRGTITITKEITLNIREIITSTKEITINIREITISRDGKISLKER